MIAYHKRVHADVFCSDISSVMRTQQQPVTVMHPQSSYLWWLRRRQKRSPSRSPSPSLQRLSQPRLQQSQERPAAALRPGPPPKRDSHRSNLLLQSTQQARMPPPPPLVRILAGFGAMRLLAA